MISILLFRAKHYIHYLFTAKGAHSIHSPFVFQLYNQVIKKSSKNLIHEIELIRKGLRKDHNIIDVIDVKSGNSSRKPVSSIAKTSLSQLKFSSFLRLLIMYLKAEVTLETGTSLGVNALYLANASSSKKIITIEGSPIISELAKRVFIDSKDKKIKLIQGSIYDEFVPALIKYKPEVVFLDADHRSSSIDFYIENILIHLPTIKCIVIHDIYWSRDMHEKWTDLVNDNRFSLTIDIYQAGLIFPNNEMPKQHFKLKF